MLSIRKGTTSGKFRSKRRNSKIKGKSSSLISLAVSQMDLKVVKTQTWSKASKSNSWAKTPESELLSAT